MEHHYSWVIPNTRRVILPGSTTVRIRGPAYTRGPIPKPPHRTRPRGRPGSNGRPGRTLYQVRVHDYTYGR